MGLHFVAGFEAYVDLITLASISPTPHSMLALLSANTFDLVRWLRSQRIQDNRSPLLDSHQSWVATFSSMNIITGHRNVGKFATEWLADEVPLFFIVW